MRRALNVVVRSTLRNGPSTVLEGQELRTSAERDGFGMFHKVERTHARCARPSKLGNAISK